MAAEIDDLLLQGADFALELVDVGGRAEPGLLPGFLAKQLRELPFEELVVGAQPGDPCLSVGEIGFERGR
ncbi:hypothetical protein ACWFPY_24300 [Nocardia fluminea]